MSLWSNSDNLGAIGPLSVTIAGTASSEFWTASATGITTVPTGTTMVLGQNPIGSAGFAVIEAPLVDENGQLVPNVVKVNILSSVPGPHPVVYSQQPIQFAHDPGYNGWANINGITTSGAAVVQNPNFPEIGRTQMPTGIGATDSEATNGTVWETGVGWVGVTTYMAFDPETQTSSLRVKKEILVAMSGIETGNRPYPETFGG